MNEILIVFGFIALVGLIVWLSGPRYEKKKIHVEGYDKTIRVKKNGLFIFLILLLSLGIVNAIEVPTIDISNPVGVNFVSGYPPDTAWQLFNLTYSENVTKIAVNFDGNGTSFLRLYDNKINNGGIMLYESPQINLTFTGISYLFNYSLNANLNSNTNYYWYLYTTKWFMPERGSPAIWGRGRYDTSLLMDWNYPSNDYTFILYQDLTPLNIDSFLPLTSTLQDYINNTISFNVSVYDKYGTPDITWYLNGINVSSGTNYNFTALSKGDYNITMIAKHYNSMFTTQTDLETSKEWLVQIINRAPILTLTNSSIIVNEVDLVDSNLIINAIDPDGDSLIISYQVPMNSTGQWQTDYNSSGNYSINISVSDGELMDSKIFNLEVLNLNRAPVLSLINNITITEGDLININPIAIDPDGDAITYGYTLPINFSGSWQTSIGNAGEYSTIVNASDGSLFDEQNVTIIINQYIAPSSPGPTGGGGCCSSSDNYNVALGEGIVNKKMYEGDVLYIKLKDGSKIKIEIKDITKDGYIKFYLSGYGDIILKIGEIKELDFDKDGIMDVTLFFEEGKFNNEVELNMETIKESKKESSSRSKDKTDSGGEVVSKENERRVTTEVKDGVSINSVHGDDYLQEIRIKTKTREEAKVKVEDIMLEVIEYWGGFKSHKEEVNNLVEKYKGNIINLYEIKSDKNNENIEEAEIDFEVGDKNINVYRLNEEKWEWQELEIKEKKKLDNGKIKLIVKTPGFSYFALVKDNTNYTTLFLIGGLIFIFLILFTYNLIKIYKKTYNKKI